MIRSVAKVPRPAAVYGVAGLVPFYAGAAGVWILPPGCADAALYLQLAYGACILSFMGGIHWGLAMAGTAADGDPVGSMSWRRLGLSILPPLAGWLAVGLPVAPLFSVALLAIAFSALFQGDLAAIRRGFAPPWYRALRKPLTVAVLVALALTIFRLTSL